MYTLCTTEKPNVAEAIAQALGADEKKEHYYIGSGYIVTWCIGHLIMLSYPDKYDPRYKKWNLDTLPFIPKEFMMEVIPETEKQFYAVKELLNRKDVDEVIDCGDAGREGCNIQWLVRQVAGCTKPVKRLWISSLTQKAIIDGMNNLYNIHKFDNMTQAAFARMRKDYIIGINATRAFTVKYGNGTTLNCGMAQTPTLGIIVSRYNKVMEFEPNLYYNIKINFQNDICATLKNKEECKLQHFKEAKIIESKLYGNKAYITSSQIRKKKLERPQLYNLTELQRDANQLYSYSAKETLDIAQTLYEMKLITYPRTASRYIPEEMEETLFDIIKCLETISVYKEISKYFLDNGLNIDDRILSNEKLTDHHAILITDNIKNFDISKLTLSQKNILHLIIARIFIVLSKSYVMEETKIEIKIDEYFFQASQNLPLRKGWKEIESLLFEKKEMKKIEGFLLHDLKEGMDLIIKDILIEEKESQQPKFHTESTLLYTMQNIDKLLPDTAMREMLKGHGIGTEATRAEIIEGLVKDGYVKREKKNKTIYLLPTQKGINLISIMPDELISFRLSAEWEMMLDEIEHGEMDVDSFIKIVTEYTEKLISDIKKSNYKVSFNCDEPVGICPRCGRAVYEISKSKIFSCEGYKNKENKCNFAIFKEDKFFMSRTQVPLKRGQVKLLLEGKTFIATCISKLDGKKYKGVFELQDKGNYVNIEMKKFVSSKR